MTNTIALPQRGERLQTTDVTDFVYRRICVHSRPHGSAGTGDPVTSGRYGSSDDRGKTIGVAVTRESNGYHVWSIVFDGDGRPDLYNLAGVWVHADAREAALEFAVQELLALQAQWDAALAPRRT